MPSYYHLDIQSQYWEGINCLYITFKSSIENSGHQFIRLFSISPDGCSMVLRGNKEGPFLVLVAV